MCKEISRLLRATERVTTTVMVVIMTVLSMMLF